MNVSFMANGEILVFSPIEHLFVQIALKYVHLYYNYNNVWAKW